MCSEQLWNHSQKFEVATASHAFNNDGRNNEADQRMIESPKQSIKAKREKLANVNR